MYLQIPLNLPIWNSREFPCFNLEHFLCPPLFKNGYEMIHRLHYILDRVDFKLVHEN